MSKDRPNFRIIEGASDDLDFDYESFKEDYQNMYISKTQILTKYHLNHNRYLRYGKRVYEETGFKRKKGCPAIKEKTFIRDWGNSYGVQKQLGDKRIYVGSYSTLEEAQRARDFLVKHDWSPMAVDCVENGRLE